MKKITALLMFAAVVIQAAAASGKGDLFSGTLEVEEDGRPVLVRCDLLRPSYDLVDLNGSKDGVMTIFSELGVDEKDKGLRAQVLGTAEMNDGQLRLRVESIGRPTPGGCGLDALMTPSP